MSDQGNGQPPGDNSGQQNGTGQQWSGNQQPWSTGGQQPWATGGQQPPSWSTGETGPNVGPTMNNPQSAYYDRFSAASGEGVVVPGGDGNKGGRGKVLIGLAAALVVVIAAVAVYALTRGGNSPTKAGGTSTSQLPPVTATTWVNPTQAGGARALQPGWVSMIGDQAMHGQYDIPDTKDWKLGTRDYAIAYMDKSGTYLAAASAVSQYGIGFCPAKKTYESAWVGMRGAGTSDPTTIGADQAQKFADGIAASMSNKPGKEGKLSAAKQIKVDQGTIPAVEYTITTTAGDAGSCDNMGKGYEVRTVTFSAGGHTYQFVTVRMLGGPKELSTSSLEQIISTFRPAN